MYNLKNFPLHNGGLSSFTSTNISIFFCRHSLMKKIMKCLLSSSNFYTDEELIQYYIIYQKVDKNNKFFQKLFQPQKKAPIFRKCLRCDDFVTTNEYKVKHDFLKHYDQGQDLVFEDKSLDIIKKSQILKYEISVNKFSDYYDFENSEEVADDYLKNLLSKFKPAGPVLVKCGFVIENIQQSALENLRPIINVCYWKSDAYRTTYFNNYVFYSLKQNILNKVIANGMSGSSLCFRRFILISQF